MTFSLIPSTEAPSQEQGELHAEISQLAPEASRGRLLTTKEVAEMLRISPKTLLRKLKKVAASYSSCTFFREASNGFRFTRHDVARLLVALRGSAEATAGSRRKGRELDHPSIGRSRSPSQADVWTQAEKLTSAPPLRKAKARA